MSKLLVSADELIAHIGDPAWRIFDCRYDLDNPDYGTRAYAKGHLPGALYLDLEHDLSGQPNGHNGRHPLPDPAVFAAKMSAAGVDGQTQVVAYDNEGGIFAARLWWLLRWLGHDRVALLDGGLPGWRRAKQPLVAELPAFTATTFVPRPQAIAIDTTTILEELSDPGMLIIDARAPERYSGAEENRDPVGGHIPGAVNRFYFDNLDDSGCYFRPAEELRAEFATLLAGRDPTRVVQQCGSGVTACHNLVAMELAGFNGSKLYPGSWSEWCANPARPMVVWESD